MLSLNELTPVAKKKLSLFLLWLNLEIKPKIGRCVVWKNYLDGKPNVMSTHARLPVESGEKYIGIKWIRESKIPPPTPKTPSLLESLEDIEWED